MEENGTLDISLVGSSLRLRGDLDISNCEQLRRRLHTLVDEGHARMEIDLQFVRYIDSVGVAAILKARAFLKRENRELVVTGASQQVRRVFRLLGLEPILTPEEP